jgi:lysosomal Pro-X carboxypeptidase
LDHFNASLHDIFTIRYILNDTFNTDRKGPILFYAGNEGAIEGFYDNSGFLTETLAAELNATVIFGEHRYYGESFPFGNKTKALEVENLKYLSVEQVMMDYVTLLQYIKGRDGYDNNTELANSLTPVYVFGGSYGGMLATWLRMKYPTHFHGAIASSAPILWFKGATDPNAYTKIASQVLKDVWSPQCFTW